MGYIPDDAEWFLADLVELIFVEGERRHVVHINTVLVQSGSADEAYKKALVIGRAANMRYRNIQGRKVTFRFLGLRELNVIHDKLEHGAELQYSEKIVRSVEKAKSLVSTKKELGVFAPGVPSSGPDYVSGDLRRELESKFGSEVMKAPQKRKVRPHRRRAKTSFSKKRPP